MIQSHQNQRGKTLQRQVYSILLVAIVALTVAVPLLAPAAETKSAPEEALLENKPWIGDFDKMDALSDKERSRLFHDVLIASIGPVTSAMVREAGLEVQIEAKEYTTKGLLKAILKYFHKHRKRS